MTSLVAQMVKHLSTLRETQVRSLGQENSPGEGNSNPLQYSCLENPMDGGEGGERWATVHGVTKSQIGLSDFTLRMRWASWIAQLVTNLPAMGETLVQSLGWEDPLEKG